ncbi:Type III secretion system lipoprotein chaperone (YscW) [Roseovarius lutimaris]|uniref:Type III secretion system lipoprotein chaperone (YscW) n=2 Tax=Roseovarius lutimaris TaxID=1005928 RepID=A0A1I4ZWM2_9RHOB|nr:Type III secretion system lipoprotein chaperone (YscW) [Roseovarius lutimaris]
MARMRYNLYAQRKQPMPRFIAMACLMALILPLPAVAQDDGARTIRGGLGYAQRIALPPEARATVVVEGHFGSMLGETSVNADGQQVPLAFEVTVPADLSGRLSAVIHIQGQPRWVLRDVAFDAGAAPLDLGTLILEPVTPMAFAVDFTCGDLSVSVGVLGREMILRAEGRDIMLNVTESASGARYIGVNDPETEVWSKGDSAMIRLEGRDLPECKKAAPPQRAGYRAGGNEPGWTVVFDGDSAEITADYGEIRRTAVRPDVQVTPGAYTFYMPSAGARLTVNDRICKDDATGMPYPHTAHLSLDDRDFRGCGGNPVDLLIGPIWQVTSLGDTPLVEPERLSLTFAASNRVAGSTGCNRMVGGFNLTGEGIHFGAMSSTMMACPAPLMEQERRMLDALEQVTRFDIVDDGALYLMGDETGAPLLIARRP